MTDQSRKWTDDEDRLLLAMKKAGKLVVEIAKELKRTGVSVIDRTATLKRRALK
jgi:hypothetical protein